MKNYSGKRITVIGAVRSGLGAAKLAKKIGAVPFVSDISERKNLKNMIAEFDKNNIEYETGKHSGKVFECDFMVTSPGVPSDADVLIKAKQKGIEVISEIEFASEVCKGKIIAITGTNGKTTTTSLCAHLINTAGLKCYSAGNIGTAFSEIALDVQQNEYVALEVSSFQLDFIKNFKPEFGILLNITPDHLNRYNNNFDNYISSKARLFENQNEEDYLIFNQDDAVVESIVKNSWANKLKFSTKTKVDYGSYSMDGNIYFANENNESELVCKVSDLNLKGEHNLSNALSVVSVAKLLKIENDVIKTALSSFKGVEHRLELVKTLNGIKFINDSKATNINSVWYALQSFDEPVLLILGGQDKGNDYNEIKDLVIKKVKKIYAIGSSAEKIYNFFEDLVPVEIIESLEKCVKTARDDAQRGDVVLLSPACASFDMFKNYEDRGRKFKNAVMSLS